MADAHIIVGDALTELRNLDAGGVQTCITSPPYYGLRDYGQEGQIGLEPTPDAYIAKLVEVFHEVKRVLRDDGTLWLNIGDSYAGSWGAQSRGGAPSESSTVEGNGHIGGGPKLKSLSDVQIAAHPKGRTHTGTIRSPGIKPKDLLGIPWMLAFALRADGWYLRSEIIWSKPNPMPESVTDRPTKAHEQVFLLSKSPRYYYDAEAIREAYEEPDGPYGTRRTVRPGIDENGGNVSRPEQFRGYLLSHSGRNKRSVWTIATRPYSEAHFATFPPKLIEPMVLAGASFGGVALDPFCGSGTTLEVAVGLGRSAIGIELSEDYAELARRRLAGVTPAMFA